jgi:hypothetical protein
MAKLLVRHYLVLLSPLLLLPLALSAGNGGDTKTPMTVEEAIYVGPKMAAVSSSTCLAAPGLPADMDAQSATRAMEMFTLSRVSYLDKPLSFDEQQPYSDVYGWHLEQKIQVRMHLEQHSCSIYLREDDTVAPCCEPWSPPRAVR